MLDCSPVNRERELGLDRRETGSFDPTVDFVRHCDSSPAQYERNSRSGPLVPRSVDRPLALSYVRGIMPEGLLRQNPGWELQ